MTVPHQTYALLLIGCASAGCDQQHLLLGSLPALDAARPDAEPFDGSELDASELLPVTDTAVLDAESPVDAEPDTSGEGLRLQFVANGLADITQLRGCRGACTEVRLVPRGGRPPYEVQWVDGSRAMTRQLCATESTNWNVWLRDQDSPSFPDDAGPFGFSYSLFVEARDCSGDAGTPGEWDVCFLPTRVESSCPAPTREEVFQLPQRLPTSEEPSVQLYLGGLLLPESVEVWTSQTGCPTSDGFYFAVQTSILSQVVKTCAPALDARYLHVRTMNVNTRVGSLEVCQRCR